MLALRLGWCALGVVLLAAYGLVGIDGLAHYTLALCSEHTLATNLTIWFEVVSGTTLAIAATALLRKKWPARGQTKADA